MNALPRYLLLLALHWLFPADAAFSADENQIKVTAILPLTGNAAGVGAAVQNGFTLALEKLPPAQRSRIRLTYEDDHFSSTAALSAFQKTANTSGTDVLIAVGSATGSVLAPLVEQKKMTFIAIASDPAVSRGRKYVFNFFVTPEEEVRMAFAEAQKRGYKRIARISTLHQGPLALKSAFDSLNNGRFDVVLDEDFPSEITDFRQYVLKAANLPGLDAVFVLLLPGQCGIFAKQFREAGNTQPLFAVEAFEDPNEVKISNGALLDQWYINADEPDRTFAEEYRKRFPGSSLWGALNSHDAVLLIAAALEHGYGKERLHEYLASLKDFKGALGTYSASGDNRFTLPAAVKVVRKTGFEKLYTDR